MNAKNVLDKIMKVLHLTEEEVLLKYGKLEDGTPVESPGFEVGDTLQIVTEEGKLNVADGEFELVIITEDGEELVNVKTEDGVILEVEAIILEDPEIVEEEVELEVDEEVVEEVIPAEVEEIPELFLKKFDELTYRIDELEKMIKGSAETSEEDEEEELEKLEGAPTEEEVRKTGKGVKNPQNSYLARLYKN